MIVDPNHIPPVLPDSRLMDQNKGLIAIGGQLMVPVYCATCFKGPVAAVPPDYLGDTFVCYVCPDCAATKPIPDGCYAVPEEVFRAKVRAECLEAHGRLLTDEELLAEKQAGITPLSKLLREGVRVHGS